MNYQYRYGTSFSTASATLYNSGGLGRYYDGIGAALFQGMWQAPDNGVYMDIKREACLSLNRSCFEIWRHCCQCWYSCASPIKLVPQRPASSRQDGIRLSLVQLFPIRAAFRIYKLTRSSAAAFRMILTPVDTLKTTLQVQGRQGTALLRDRIRKHGLGTLWWGAFATAGATFVGHYPWFATVCLLRRAADCMKTGLCLQASHVGSTTY